MFEDLSYVAKRFKGNLEKIYLKVKKNYLALGWQFLDLFLKYLGF